MTDPQRIAAALGKIGENDLADSFAIPFLTVSLSALYRDCAEARLCRWAERRQWNFLPMTGDDDPEYLALHKSDEHGPFPTKLDAVLAAVEAEK